MADFNSEREMVAPAAAWLRGRCAQVKNEFVLPWGVCDLMGATLNRRRAAQRLALGQTRAIGPAFRIALLLDIPSTQDGRAKTAGKIEREYDGLVGAERIRAELDKLEKERFIVQVGRRTYQRVDGWVPLHTRLISVELKLSRVREALSQAMANQGAADESYVGLPTPIARAVRSNGLAHELRDAGIGLVEVGHDSCRVLVRAKKRASTPDPVTQLHCVERFWRTRPTSSSP